MATRAMNRDLSLHNLRGTGGTAPAGLRTESVGRLRIGRTGSEERVGVPCPPLAWGDARHDEPVSDEELLSCVELPCSPAAPASPEGARGRSLATGTMEA